jgi:hypothetical protein
MKSLVRIVIIVCLLPGMASAEPMSLDFVIGPQTGSTFALSYRKGLVVPEVGIRMGLLGFSNDHLGDMTMHVGLLSPRVFLFEHCGEKGVGLEVSLDAVFGFNLGGVYLGGFFGLGFKPVHIYGDNDRWLYNVVSEFGLAVIIPVSESTYIISHFDFIWTPPLESELLLSPISTALKLEVLFDL